MMTDRTTLVLHLDDAARGSNLAAELAKSTALPIAEVTTDASILHPWLCSRAVPGGCGWHGVAQDQRRTRVAVRRDLKDWRPRPTRVPVYAELAKDAPPDAERVQVDWTDGPVQTEPPPEWLAKPIAYVDGDAPWSDDPWCPRCGAPAVRSRPPETGAPIWLRDGADVPDGLQPEERPTAEQRIAELERRLAALESP